ncbi:hypothetical protein DPSP01_014251 [Paraphaeosphaeria sporulosa]
MRSDNAVNGNAAAEDNWLKAMLYLCFTNEANLLPACADKEPIQVEPIATQEQCQDIGDPDGEVIKPAASGKPGK